MPEKIKYKMSFDKAIEIIVWLASNNPGIDIYHVAKVVFFAEKAHINKYAKPIVGERYCKLDYGPIPSNIVDLINKNEFLSPRHLERMEKAVVVDIKNHKSITPLRAPDMSYFSGTEIDCLQEALTTYSKLSFEELFERTHKLKLYIETDLKETIDYALFVDDDNPHREQILTHLHETSPYLHV